MRNRGWFIALALAAFSGCGHETDESSFSDSFCEDASADCNGSGECEFAQECFDRSCREEEGYEDDGDFYYKTRCTEEVTLTQIFYPEGGGSGTERVSTDTEDCRYKEEEDYWDYEYDEDFSCDRSTDVDERQVECDPVSCATCSPICY